MKTILQQHPVCLLAQLASGSNHLSYERARRRHLMLGRAGMAHKGTSVVLYRWPTLRQYQYTAITDWSGGLYISPGFAGSRSVS